MGKKFKIGDLVKIVDDYGLKEYRNCMGIITKGVTDSENITLYGVHWFSSNLASFGWNTSLKKLE